MKSGWTRDKAIPHCYWKGEEMVRAVRKPFGLTYTIMHRKRIGEQPSYFGVFPTIKRADEAVRQWIKKGG